MTDYEYILKQARKFHYSKWTDEELRRCVDMLVGLSRQELVSLYTSKWTKDEKVLKEEIFKILYVDKLGKREERIKNLSTNELIEEFKDRQSGNIALIRQEMKYRYKENVGDDRAVITQAFINSSKGDQNWIELQERKELFGNSKK